VSAKINGVKGMNDVLPGQVGRWHEIEAVAREVFALYGYREVRTPIVEAVELYVRGVGEETDVVNKEMYTFQTRPDRHGKTDTLALRPEGTAGTVRAFIEHGAYVEGPQKWFYMGAMFRAEQPQAGRYRQFHQAGCEAFGIAEPAIDAEQIAMLADFLERLGVKFSLKINSVGDPACRPAYLDDLRAYLTANAGALCENCRQRTQRNPLRVLDCKVPTCQPVLQKAPQLLERLCDGCRDHFAAVKAGLDALGVSYVVEPRLVRGLDYYIRTAYEFTSDALGAQSAVAGGGRYDGLVETLGGPPTPGIGYGLGLERLAIILDKLQRPIPARVPEVFFVSADPAGAAEALRLAAALRKGGIACDLDARGGKFKTQVKQAERVGAKFLLVLGGNEVASGEAKLKDMTSRVETPVKLAELAAALRPSK